MSDVRLFHVGYELRDAAVTDEDSQSSRMGAIASIAADSPGASEESSVPEAVVDALVETAWSFPGLRVSYARVQATPRRLHYL